MADLGEQWATLYQPLQDMKSDGTWAARRAEFIGKLPDAQDPATDAFLAYMDAMTDGQRAGVLRTEQADSLLYAYLEQYSDESDTESDDESAAEDSPWDEFIDTNGPVWNGEEETWDQFREWFVYHANEAGFSAELAELMAEADGADIESRIAVLGRGRVAKRKCVESDSQRPAKKKNTQQVAGKDGQVGTAPRTSGRLAVRKERAQALGATLTVDTTADGTLTQHLDQEDSIGFHMVVTLSVEAGAGSVESLYELRQYVRDAYDKGEDDRQELSEWDEDRPFCPPYATDGTVTITPTVIQLDDYPGFSTTSKIGEDEWLHSYQADFQWVVTRIADGVRWTSAELSNTLESGYNDGEDTQVDSTPSGRHEWEVTFG